MKEVQAIRRIGSEGETIAAAAIYEFGVEIGPWKVGGRIIGVSQDGCLVVFDRLAETIPGIIDDVPAAGDAVPDREKNAEIVRQEG